MKNLLIAIVFAIVAAMSFPVMAADPTNDELFRDIHAELNQLQILATAIINGTIEIWPGYEVTIPVATINEMKTQCAALRTSIRAKFLLLSLE